MKGEKSQMKQMLDYCNKGYCRFARDERLVSWIDSISSAAEAILADPAHSHWWRCGGTWFAGVNILDNDAQGKYRDSLPLQGAAFDFMQSHILPHIPRCNILDRAQISVCTFGYPQKDSNDNDEIGYNFRKNRDAAHLDGLLKENNLRFLREYHGYILGIGLNDVDEDSAPVVIYEKSHLYIKEWLSSHFKNTNEPWDNIDLTESYKTIRHEILQSCKRICLPLKKGEALLLHRFSIHGTSPWLSSATIPRKLAFFRPITTNRKKWLQAP